MSPPPAKRTKTTHSTSSRSSTSSSDAVAEGSEVPSPQLSECMQFLIVGKYVGAHMCNLIPEDGSAELGGR